MTIGRSLLCPVLIWTALLSCSKESTKPPTGAANINLINVELDNRPFSYSYSNSSISPEIILSFSEPIDHQSAQSSLLFNGGTVPIVISFSQHDSTLTVRPV